MMNDKLEQEFAEIFKDDNINEEFMAECRKLPLASGGNSRQRRIIRRKVYKLTEQFYGPEAKELIIKTWVSGSI